MRDWCAGQGGLVCQPACTHLRAGTGALEPGRQSLITGPAPPINRYSAALDGVGAVVGVTVIETKGEPGSGSVLLQLRTFYGPAREDGSPPSERVARATGGNGHFHAPCLFCMQRH